MKRKLANTLPKSLLTQYLFRNQLTAYRHLQRGCGCFSNSFSCWNTCQWCFFHFLKIIFDISTSKRSKKYKPHSILAKKKIQNLTKRSYKRNAKQTLSLLWYLILNHPSLLSCNLRLLFIQDKKDDMGTYEKTYTQVVSWSLKRCCVDMSTRGEQKNQLNRENWKKNNWKNRTVKKNRLKFWKNWPVRSDFISLKPNRTQTKKNQAKPEKPNWNRSIWTDFGFYLF
jgi:hypothetical protein